MKQIFTLLFSITTFTTVFAQTRAEREEAKRVILGERKESTSYPASNDNRTVYRDRSNQYPQPYPTNAGATRERQSYEINREYDAKIYSIRTNNRLSRSERDRIIRGLEADRRRNLDATNQRNYGSKNRNYDDYNDYASNKNKEYKTNNGNHYGWQKGKGNPHN